MKGGFESGGDGGALLRRRMFYNIYADPVGIDNSEVTVTPFFIPQSYFDRDVQLFDPFVFRINIINFYSEENAFTSENRLKHGSLRWLVR